MSHCTTNQRSTNNKVETTNTETETNMETDEKDRRPDGTLEFDSRGLHMGAGG